MKINKNFYSSLHQLVKRNSDKKDKKTMKERDHIKIKLYNLRGQVVGEIGQGESVDYNELLLKKRR